MLEQAQIAKITLTFWLETTTTNFTVVKSRGVRVKVAGKLKYRCVTFVHKYSKKNKKKYSNCNLVLSNLVIWMIFLVYADLLSTNRSSIFSGHHGQLSLSTVYLDEYRDRLFLGGKDVMYSLLLGPGRSESKEVTFQLLDHILDNKAKHT